MRRRISSPGSASASTTSWSRPTCKPLGFSLVGGRLLPVNGKAGRDADVSGHQAGQRLTVLLGHNPENGETSFRFAHPQLSRPSTGSTANIGYAVTGEVSRDSCSRSPRNVTGSFPREDRPAADRCRARSAGRAASPPPPAASSAVRSGSSPRSAMRGSVSEARKGRHPAIEIVAAVSAAAGLVQFARQALRPIRSRKTRPFLAGARSWRRLPPARARQRPDRPPAISAVRAIA